MAQHDSKFTPDVVHTLIASRAAGKSAQDCATDANITRRTISAWLRLGNRGVEPFATFSKAYDDARSQYERDRIASIVASVRPSLQIA